MAAAAADELSPASIDDLRSALRDSLDKRGVLGRLRAQLRSEIFHTIDAGADAPKPRTPRGARAGTRVASDGVATPPRGCHVVSSERTRRGDAATTARIVRSRGDAEAARGAARARACPSRRNL